MTEESGRTVVVCVGESSSAELAAIAVAKLRENGVTVIEFETAPAKGDTVLVEQVLAAAREFDFKLQPAPSSLPYYRRFERKRKWR